MTEIMELFQKMLKESPEKSKKQMEKVLNILLESEQEDYLQRKPYERKAGVVDDNRNGYKPRTLQSRFGSLSLRNPQTRKGFSSSLFERYQRSERAILISCAEMYLNGVSTRKVSKLVADVFGVEISAGTVSKYSKELDEVISEWRQLPIGDNYKYLFVDATYLKCRERSRIISKAVYIAVGVSSSGNYRVLGFMTAGEESESSWKEFFERLKARGLSGVELVISDKHKGLVLAIEKCFTKAQWQRCVFHFKQNFLSNVAKKHKASFNDRLNLIFSQINKAESLIEAKNQISYFENHGYPKLAEFIEENIEEALTYKNFPGNHWRRLRTTNKLERLNQEIKRRSKPIRIFSNIESIERVVGYLLMETDEHWMDGRAAFK